MICTMYCTNCGIVLSSTHLFCGFCGQEKPHSSIETQNFCDETSSKENRSNCHDNLMDNKSNDTHSLKRKSDVMSFGQYKAVKGSQWKERVTKKSKPNEVGVQIGMLERGGKDFELKPIRNQTILLNIGKTESVDSILEKAVKKYLQFYPKSHDDGASYYLAFRDGRIIDLLPGTDEPFTIIKYKENIGKDYSRIFLYLVKEEKEDAAEHQEDDLLPDFPLTTLFSDPHNFIDCFSIDELQKTANKECDSSQKNESQIKKYENISEVLSDLNKNIDDAEQLYIIVRRSAPVARYLALWQREVNTKGSANKRVVVKFQGENGIDSGAMAKEFFAIVVRLIREHFCPDGSPVDSMLYVQNGYFKACGEIIAASLVQGGPAPFCFHSNVFKMLTAINSIDIRKLDLHIHFTESEKQLIQRISDDPSNPSYSDTILEHGYTGLVSADHTTDITRTLMVSITNRRLCYLKEFLSGLELFGIFEALQRNPLLFEPLFITSSERAVDANYVASLLIPNHSDENSSKRIVEEKIMDNFVDFLMHLEDNKVNVTGHEILANDENDCHLISCTPPDLTPAGVLGWLTGQKHRPIFGNDLQISVQFDHYCLENNPKHSICYPVVGACGRVVTLPAKHMEKENDFRSIFLTAICNAQAFGLH
ncbi:uncharacterized protein LOC143451854 isoform X1 [Clavelina lepadiformis]|uniref:uncharacterized protein LOC143451854 isoform X1 n=1 Tax=Clavelina lepadiformis TaxID=159417 RepID=UPI004041E767